MKDPSCQRRKNNWETVLNKAWIHQQLVNGEDDGTSAAKSPSRWKKLAEALHFDWIQSLFDRRVTMVEWGDDPDSTQIMTGQNFRRRIGFGKIKSTRFTAEDLGDRIRFVGKGSGHGVGLCQWGARDWATEGYSANQILKHYYPLAQLSIPRPLVSSLPRTRQLAGQPMRRPVVQAATSPVQRKVLAKTLPPKVVSSRTLPVLNSSVSSLPSTTEAALASARRVSGQPVYQNKTAVKPKCDLGSKCPESTAR